MTMNSPASRIIVEVERAIGDLRRGQPVILTQHGKASRLVLSGEHHPQMPAIADPGSPAVQLMKISGLLPRAIVTPFTAGEEEGCLAVSAESIAVYPASLAATLEKVSEANVPLQGGLHARFIAFRPRFGHEEHLAVVIGDLASRPAPLIRLHSCCVTGDVFASLRCDCGAQLHKALSSIAEEGVGAVLYLHQEGRGIGIANKLRAYALQDQGMDTVEANSALGFEADERDFAIAATMLRALNATRITLLTNNPRKIEALTRYGIAIKERREVLTQTTLQNRAYLATKAVKMGHILPGAVQSGE